MAMMESTKKCNKCGVLLVAGCNWYESYRTNYTYMCIDCSRTNTNNLRYRNGSKPMSQNKSCSSYLGIHVAERVLSKVFDNVKPMSPTNHGFDFICNRGMKIDVKSSCNVTKNPKHSDRWTFTIRKNKIADYFLCLAFDNRKKLTPLHMWLIPGNMCENLHILSVSSTTISKLDEYTLDISKVVKCCDAARVTGYNQRIKCGD